ncbi:MAG TPA: RIP metalloprotease RseP [Candidatus Angelobacter sp.]
MQILIYLAAVALVLGVLVFVHEFGHYAVAKLCGVRVEVFSLGFGKRLWGFRRGDTDYRLSLLPLGGYVKMAGENPMENRTGDPGEFTSHPRWQRFLIAIAGPTMNVILAILVFAVVFKFHHDYYFFERQPVNIFFVAPGSVAEKAGIRPGDKIVKIDDVENPNWTQAWIGFGLSASQTVEVTVQRGDQPLPMKLVPEPKGAERMGDVGLVPPEFVGTLEADMPAAKAGVHVGDALVSVNGTPVRNTQEVQDVLAKTKDAPVQLIVWRDGKELPFTLIPVLTPTSQGDKYRIGFSPQAVERLPFPAAFRSSLAECKTNSLLIFKLLGKMVQQPRNTLGQMSGPIGITIISGEAAKAGFWQYIWVMALISLNLAVFNLLPIPILDGGLMLMLGIEGIMRRDINQEIKERVYQVAFVFLLVFAAVVIYNDIAKTLPGHLL